MAEMEHQAVEPVVEAASAAEVVENMVPQSKVNEIVHERHKAGYEKGKREALAQWQAQQKAAEAASPLSVASIGGMPGLSAEQIRQLVAEEAKRAQAEHANAMYAQQVANQFIGKVLGVKEKYQDFDEVVDMGSLKDIPQVAELINEFDNTGDILYELKKHPHKMSSVITLLQQNLISDARRAVGNLSDSIKTNQTAGNVKQPSDPLNPVKPSTINHADNGERSIADLRSDPRYRC